MRTFFLLSLLALGCIAPAILVAEETKPVAAASADIDYARDVQPIFTKYCTACHHADESEGKLALDSYAALIAGGKSGASITAGRADTSRLMMLVRGTQKPVMPPRDNDAPTAAEVAIIEQWIAAGAKPSSGEAPDPTMLVVPKIALPKPPRLAVTAIAVSTQGDLVAIARPGEIEVRSLADNQTVFHHKNLRGSVNAIGFSRDGKIVAAGAGEPGLIGETTLLSTARGEVLRTLRGQKDSVYSLRLSPDGSILATGSYDNTIALWDVASGKLLRSLDGHGGAIYDIAFRSDGKVLASASGDRTVKLWNVADGSRLETLKESTKELYAIAFSPDGKRVAAAGVDNRIRVWQVSDQALEGTNPLLYSQFAHELAVLRLDWSSDGETIVSTAEDRQIKVWNADDMTIRAVLEKQSDWATGVAIVPSGDRVVVGRMDGTTGELALPQNAGKLADFKPLEETPTEVDYGKQPAENELAKFAEVEPNNAPDRATPITVPGIAQGKIHGEGGASDVDLFRITAKQGEQLIFETRAAKKGSPLDSKIEVLDLTGKSVPRLLLRAVRDTEVEFRGMSSEQRGVRLKYWEEMLLNDYVYLNGEVIKHFQQRRGPDADAQFYPENGNRFAIFDTTPRTHALGEPGYLVVPYAIGTPLPSNGLPVFTIHYENDDDALRKLGRDSKLLFVAPVDGDYLVRVTDVRNYSGENYSYDLLARRRAADFSVSINPADLKVNAGGGRSITVKAERADYYRGPITVHCEGFPAGFQVKSPVVIPEGLSEAQVAIFALEDAVAPTSDALAAIKIRAEAQVAGQLVSKEVASPKSLVLEPRAKVQVFLERIDEKNQATVPTLSSGFPEPASIEMEAGGSVSCHLRILRHGFEDRVALEVQNLPHGVIVDDIGLSGVLVREKETDRSIFLRAEPWVQPQTRLIHAVAQVEGNQVSLPMLLTIKPRGNLVTRASAE